MAETIILVPGLFGFARIGAIDYFASVAPILARCTGIADLSPLATPPTGPLWRRVAHLWERVRVAVNEGASRVHIVGHSTGGLDARLLCDARYLWPGGPTGADRVAFFDRLGAVVSISGPHKGTPIARRMRGTLEGGIPLLFMGSFLAKYDVQHAQQAHQPHQEGAGSRMMRRLDLYRRLGLAFAGRPTARYSAADLEGMPGDTAKALLSFLDEIIDDHPLIHDLTPYAMNRLNEHLKFGGSARTLPVTNFISVAPPPALHRADIRWKGGVNPFLRGLYATSHMETRLEPNEFGPVLEGAWIGKPPNFESFAATAQDGVVPAASQSFDGSVESYVYGDHMDVVGHYPSAKHGGETLFDSGADFDDDRLEQLWGAVGAVIRRSSKGPTTGASFASSPSAGSGQAGVLANGGKSVS